MRKRRIAILLLASVALVFLAAVLVTGNAEPEYKGKPMSWWLEENFSEGVGHNPEYAMEAIRHIGTNGIPWLLDWVVYDPYDEPHWKTKLWNSVPDKVRESRLTQRLFDVRADARFLGAIDAFAILGTNALVPLMTLAANSNAPNRLNAIFALGCLGTNAIPALPLILRYLAEPGSEVAGEAATALTNLRLDPQHAVPALTNRFQTADAKLRGRILWALRSYGREAGSAVPTLMNALNDPDLEVQKRAAAILQKIAPEALETNAAH